MGTIIQTKILTGIGILAVIAAIVLISGCVEEKPAANCSVLQRILDMLQNNFFTFKFY